MSYKRKTHDIYQVVTNYGWGWEVECEEFTLRDALQRYREYKENTNAQVIITKRREKNVSEEVC